jgi:hypothetical protein
VGLVEGRGVRDLKPDDMGIDDRMWRYSFVRLLDVGEWKETPTG